MEICKNCKGNDIISDSRTSDIICRSCGEVQGQVFYNGPDWFDGVDARATCSLDDFSYRIFADDTPASLRDAHRRIIDACSNDIEMRRVAIILLERFKSVIPRYNEHEVATAMICMAHKECYRDYSIKDMSTRMRADPIRVGRLMRKCDKHEIA